MVLKFLALGLCVALVSVPAGADCQMEFEFGNESSALTGPSRALLNRIMQVYPKSRFTISGHAEMAGNASGNRALAWSRSEAVRGYVVAAGADPQNVVTQPAPAQLSAGRGADLLGTGRVVRMLVVPCDAAYLSEYAAAAGPAPTGAIGGLSGSAVLGGLLLGALAASLVGASGGSETSSTAP